jgi:L-rhamnose mutarotase|tara:strand:+ start:16536 stop:16880 length:345 start_codon:yes stop_codon:yes gene_type:complete
MENKTELAKEVIRKSFVMSVAPDKQNEYKLRHDNIWPELEKALKEHGVKKYSIFLDSSSSKLFAYLEIESEVKWNDLANTDICKKWWKYMSDIMPANPDYSPKSEELHEVFRLT